ncbi:hypothetical protein WDU94_013447 [Cyamophila willieti]
MNESQKFRKFVTQSFKLNGFSLTADALSFIVQQLEPIPSYERDSWLDKLVDQIHKQTIGSPFVEKSHIEEALKECCRTEINSEEQIFSVISAFDIPQFVYDADAKKFKAVDKPETKLCADPSAKSKLFRERYNIIRQRTLRHSLFSNINPNATDGFKLDWIEYLNSLTNVKHRTVVLGMISQLKENKYFLEDPTGIVQLDLSQTSYHAGLFTENCIVLAEGYYQDQILHVEALGFPPPEQSKTSRLYFGNQNIWGGPSAVSLKSVSRMVKMEESNESAMIVVLSDVHLDNAKVIDRLQKLFTGFRQCPPTAIIIMGEFLSIQYGSKHSHVLKEKLATLGMMIADHPYLSETHFVIVPAQNDSPHVNVLPRPSLPKFITGEFQSFVPHSTMATNPCRIQYCSQEILVVREELLSKMCRNCIHFPEEGDIAKHFIRTLVSQGSLVSLPLNLCPVYWSQVGALSLYPLPDVVILGDQLNAFSIVNTDCLFINPGSFVKQDFGFKVYIPSTRQVEDSQIPDDD